MISIIIIVKNDRRIERVLAKLQDMKSSKPFEVIVVDASEEKLDDIKKTYSFVHWITYVNRDKSRTYAEQRNIGIKKAKGDIIAFIDADCIPEDEWIDNLIKPIYSEKEAFISGSIKPIDKNNAHIEEHYPRYRDECETMNMAVTKKLVEDVGLFDESMEGCEDSDFCIRAREKGYKIRFQKSAVVYHDWGGVMQNIKRSFNGGKDRASLYFKHPKLLFSLTINNIYTFYYIGFILFLPIAFIFPPYILILFLPSVIKRRNPIKELYNLAFSTGLIIKAFKLLSESKSIDRPMVVYVFNNVFPDNAGFGKRCRKEIEMLSKKAEVVVVCKRDNGQKKSEIVSLGDTHLSIFRFSTGNNTQHIENYEEKKGWYEIYRNLQLVLSMMGTLGKIFMTYWNKNKKLYIVVSPLTVPFIAYLLGFLFGVKRQVVEFHDLEPELAKDIKKLSDSSLIMKIEYFLEKFVCQRFEHIVVTTQAQAARIVAMTRVSKDKVVVIPNSIQVETINSSVKPSTTNKLQVGYVSSFTFEYSTKCFKDLLQIVAKRSECKDMHFTVVGDGPILSDVKKLSEKLGISNQITYTGNRPHVLDLVAGFDVALVPWPQTDMTVTMAPTKLFEYMSMGKVIVAPNFGEFTTILTHGQNALLYSSVEQLFELLCDVQKNDKIKKELSERVHNLFEKKYKPNLYEKQLQDLIL